MNYICTKCQAINNFSHLYETICKNGAASSKCSECGQKYKVALDMDGTSSLWILK